MKQAYLLFSCNAWHEHAGKRLLGVFTCQTKLNSYLKAMKRARRIDDDDLDMLLEQRQTQGREENYLIEIEDINPEFVR